MSEFIHTADLRSLRAAVANSPIVVASQPPADFADWCERLNTDLDTVILDWLRSQAPARKPTSLS